MSWRPYLLVKSAILIQLCSCEIYADPDIYIERSTHADELRALTLFEKYADQKISFTDCISFAIMERLNIKQVFGFDQHFQYSGFELLEL